MKKLLLLLTITLFLNTNAQTPITATIPYQGFGETQGFLGEAEYQIFLDNTTGNLDKPIILVDGFDPTDTRDITGMYNLLAYNGQNMADVLRDEGFDIILLNFPVYTNSNDDEIDGGVDFIQRNSMILVELINQINTQKIGTEELVIIGPSMGGLISRYALRYMEQNSLDHQTRLYISWDSPHLGANIPIGFQYLFNYIAIQANDAQIQAAIDTSLNSPASKQMLIDHYKGHLQSGSDVNQDPNILLPTGAPNFRDAFQNELDAMGFPQQVRNITVANGSGLGTMIGSPGTNVINSTFDVPNVPNTTAEVEVNFTPVASQTQLVTNADIIALVFGFPVTISSFDAFSESPTTSSGLDSAPGGKYDIASFTGAAQGNQLLQDFIDALNQSAFSFIPTLSSLAIINETNWYVTPNLDGTHNSDFVAWYIPDINEDHVTLTQENVDFVLPEIRNQVVGVNDVTLSDKYQLKANPVSNNITIQLNNNFNYNNVTVSLVNITGQKLLSKTYDSVTNEINLPINIQKGIYFLTITDFETKFSAKLIVTY